MAMGKSFKRRARSLDPNPFWSTPSQDAFQVVVSRPLDLPDEDGFQGELDGGSGIEFEETRDPDLVPIQKGLPPVQGDRASEELVQQAGPSMDEDEGLREDDQREVHREDPSVAVGDRLPQHREDPSVECWW